MDSDFRADGKTLVKYLGNDYEVKVPEGITKIKNSAFFGIKNIDVILPSTIEKVQIGYRDSVYYGEFRSRHVSYDIYKTMPEWSIGTIGTLSDEIATLLKQNWLNQMTERTWAVLYLTQDSEKFREIFKEHMRGDPNAYLTAMIELIRGSVDGRTLTNAAYYAAENHGAIKRSLIEELYALVKLGGEAGCAEEILKSVLFPKEIDPKSPYAWLYEKFDEPKLKKLYRDYGGDTDALNSVLSVDGNNSVPQIAVLAAVVPYLDFYDRKTRLKFFNPKVKILPDSDRAAAMIKRCSIIDFITKNTDIKENTKWMFPYCRYASEGEIETLIEARKKCARGAGEPYYNFYLPSSALLLSDYYAPRVEFFKGLNQGLDWGVREYAKLRGIPEDAVLADIRLDEEGKVSYDLNGTAIAAVMTKDFHLLQTSEKNGILSGDFKLSKRIKADLKRKSVHLEQAVKIRTEALFKDFLSGRELDFEEWRRAVFAAAVNKRLAELIVWEQGGATFTVKDGKLIDSSRKEFALGDAPVKLAHPMEMSAEDIEAWRQYLKKESIKQPFVQIEEPAIDLTAVKAECYDNVCIPIGNFRNKGEHGIFYHCSHIEFKDCTVKFTVNEKYRYYGGVRYDDDADGIIVYKFEPIKYNRQANHIAALLNKWTAEELVKADDMRALDFIEDAGEEELSGYADTAIEHGAKNLTAKLLEMKRERFGEFGFMDEFSLGEW